MSRFVVLSGPSCIGKGPLFAALRRLYPDLAARLKPVVLFNDRAPRPGEMDGVDYHFRPRHEIEALREKAGYVVVDVRGDLQALEVESIQRIMDEGFDPFFEGNPFVPSKLREAGVFDRFDALTVFLAPLSREEILYLQAPERAVDLAAFVTDVQRRKLLHRTRRQKVNLSLKDLENIEKRAASAIVEMREAPAFEHVIPVHDGEGNDNWDAFYYPIGSARVALGAFAAILQGKTPAGAERWEEGLVPG
jgi:guanylate kinase